MASRCVSIFILILLCGPVVPDEKPGSDIWLILDVNMFFDVDSMSSKWKQMSKFFVDNFDISIGSNESETRIRVCRHLNKFNANRTHNECGAENQEIFANDWNEFNRVFNSTPYELGNRNDVKDALICKLFK